MRRLRAKQGTGCAMLVASIAAACLIHCTVVAGVGATRALSMPLDLLPGDLSLDDPAVHAHSQRLQEHLKLLPRRRLHDTDGDSSTDVTQVSTFQELLDAWTEGAANIELVAHIDSAGFPLISAEINGGSFSHVLPPQKESTVTVMGNCVDPPGADITDALSGVPLGEVKQGQCVILADKHLMPVVTGTVLVDNIYIRFNAPIAGSFAGEDAGETSTVVPSLFHSHGGKAWVSNLTVQGDGVSPCGAVVVYAAAQLKFIDTDFTDLYASTTLEGPKPTALVKESSAVSYLRTRAINVVQDDGVPIYGGTSTVKLSFQECEFENNTLPLHIQVVPGARVYSDNRTELVWQDVGDADPVDPEPALALSAAESSGFFLTLQDPEYIALKDGMALQSPAGTGGVGGSDGLSDGAKIGIGVAASVAALLAAAVLGYVCMRRRAKTPEATDTAAGSAKPTPKQSMDMHEPSRNGSVMPYSMQPPQPGVVVHPHANPPNVCPLPHPVAPPGTVYYANASQLEHDFYSPAVDPIHGSIPDSNKNGSFMNGNVMQPNGSFMNGSIMQGNGSMMNGAAMLPCIPHVNNSAMGSQGGAVIIPPHYVTAPHQGANPTYPSSRNPFSQSAPGPMDAVIEAAAPGSSAAGTLNSATPSQDPSMVSSAPNGSYMDGDARAAPPGGGQFQANLPHAHMNGYYPLGPAPGVGMKPTVQHQESFGNGPASACAPHQLPMPEPESAHAHSEVTEAITVSENLNSRNRSVLQKERESHESRAGVGLQSVRTYDSVGEVTDMPTGSKALGICTPPERNASMQDKMEFLHCQLDSLRNRQILSGLLLQDGASNRLVGGQAIVQFATHVVSKVEYAVKFFVSNAAFHDEHAQYRDSASPLRAFLPKARDIIPNDDGAFVDARGHPMPSCIIMEKGESLDRWVQRNRRIMDPFTCMQILYHVCECLIDLHTAGYVHRDLKPANIMWLPSQNRWTIIDFGCTAKINSDARMGFSLLYAAPEVVSQVFREGHVTMRASTAQDAWSLGILAVELFTGRPAMRLIEGREKVVKQIVGEEPLPWEGPDGGRELLKRAGKLRNNVLRLLDRSPSERITVDAFLQCCSNMLSTTTQMSAESRDSQVSH